MKNLGPLLAGGLTLVLVLLVGLFSFLPAQSIGQAETASAAQTGPIVVPAVDATQVEANLTEREAVYQTQIQELDQAWQQRQTTYQSQIQTLNSQITATQNQLTELKAQEQNLSTQIIQLENARAERLATYQTELEKLNNQYSGRLAQLQVQLNEAQVKLAEVNAQLGQ
jgi:septal ring factor EnvC (AmiA/AmiB activator)